MKWSNKLRRFVAGIFLAGLSGMAHAEDTGLNLALPSSKSNAQDLQSYIVASNDLSSSSNAMTNIASAKPNSTFQEPWISGSKVHEYLGLGTLLSVIATSLTAPNGDCKSNCANQQNQTTGTHQSLGRATRVLALSTVATGLMFHWDDMHLIDDGLKDPDTQHWLLGSAGALILANAVSKAPARSHSGQAELGAAMMLVAVKLTW
jgi:hypothetical protein